jgi:hypothetical protein
MSRASTVDAYGRPLDVMDRLRGEARALDRDALAREIATLTDRQQREGIVGEDAMRWEVLRDEQRSRG